VRKGSRVPSGAKRRPGHGDRRGGASRMCRPDEVRKKCPQPPVSDEGGVRRLSGAPMSRRAERPRVLRSRSRPQRPRNRQSERSEVCRNREKGKYLLPEGRAGRRAAVVRRVPEAGRRDSHQPRSGRVQAKRGRAGYGAPATYKAGGPRRSRSAARVRRWPGG